MSIVSDDMLISGMDQAEDEVAKEQSLKIAAKAAQIAEQLTKVFMHSLATGFCLLQCGSSAPYPQMPHSCSSCMQRSAMKVSHHHRIERRYLSQK